MSPEQEWKILADVKKLKQDVKDLHDELKLIRKMLDSKVDVDLYL